MTNGPNLNWIASNTSDIDDDVLRDVIVRGKCHDVILPMGVVRRLDAGLESTKRAVPNMKAARDTAATTNQASALPSIAGRRCSDTLESQP